MIYVKAYSGALLAFLALDALWLGFVAKSFYASQLGDLMRAKPEFIAAGVFYLAYVVGVVYFAVGPALDAANPLRAAVINGVLLGLLAYGTYDMTNYATLKGWPPLLVAVDLAWGAFITAAAAASGYALTRI